MDEIKQKVLGQRSEGFSSPRLAKPGGMEAERSIDVVREG